MKKERRRICMRGEVLITRASSSLRYKLSVTALRADNYRTCVLIHMHDFFLGGRMFSAFRVAKRVEGRSDGWQDERRTYTRDARHAPEQTITG